VQSKFRESVDPTGRLTYLSFPERKTVIGDMPVIDLSTGANVTVRQALAQ
jgi:hypothetical protein